jgi:hypothetical protein
LELIAAASFTATLISGFGVGARLLALARASQRAPELFVGSAVTLLAAAALLEVTALELVGRGQDGLAHPVEVLALALHSASAASLCVGTWRIFSPDRHFAPLLCILVAGVLFESWAAVILPGQHTSSIGFTPWFHLHVAARGFAFAWAAAATGSHALRLRRQVALGLADAFVCHRFGLWAAAMASSTAILATALFTNTTRGVLVFAWPPALLAVSVLGIVGSLSLWLAFLPPARYRRLVERRLGFRYERGESGSCVASGSRDASTERLQ